MKKKIRFGVRLQLFAGFLFVNLLILTIFIVNQVFQSHIASVTDDVFLTTDQLVLAQDIDYYGRSADDSGASYLLSSAQSEEQTALKKYNSYITIVHQDLVKLRAMSADPQEIQDLNQFTQNWNAYLDRNNNAFQMFQQQDATTAYQDYVQNSFEAVMQPLMNYTQYEKAANQSNRSELANTRAKNSTTFLIIVILSIIAGLVIAGFISERLSKSIKKVKQVSQRVAEGDLTVEELLPKSRDEISDLMLSTNVMVKQLRGLIASVAETSEQVAASAEELTASAEETSNVTTRVSTAVTTVAKSAEQQMESATESARAMEEMARGIQSIAETSSNVAGASADASELAVGGNKNIQDAIAQMNSVHQSVTDSASKIQLLSQESAKIQTIVSAITGIAAQTNLLALNAAIEAARAGEHGRGFSVVADEVRTLAEQSAASAKEISRIVEGIRHSTLDSVSSMERVTKEAQSGLETIAAAGSSFEQILTATENVNQQIQDVSAATQQISAATQQVSASIDSMADLSQQSSQEVHTVATSAEAQLSSMEEISSSALALSKMAQDLQSLVGSFKI